MRQCFCIDKFSQSIARNCRKIRKSKTVNQLLISKVLCNNSDDQAGIVNNRSTTVARLRLCREYNIFFITDIILNYRIYLTLVNKLVRTYHCNWWVAYCNYFIENRNLICNEKWGGCWVGRQMYNRQVVFFARNDAPSWNTNIVDIQYL